MSDQDKPEPRNEGTLILDATCAPDDIHYPTDVALLNDSCEKLEEMIDDLQIGCDEMKPRTYRQKAHQLNLRFARNCKNRQYCADLGIRMNGPNLGRPPRDKQVYDEQERSEAGERNAVEGKFGEAKRCYTLSRVMTRLKNTSEVSIHMTFLVMNLEKRLRDIILLFYRWLFTEQLAFA